MFLRYFVILLFLLSLCGTMFADVERDVSEASQNIKAVRKTRSELARREGQLNERLQAATKSPSSADTERLRRELDETRQMREALAGSERVHQQYLNTLKASPEYHYLQTVARDRRKPSKDNLSGVWSSPANLVGQTWQLNQRGLVITGRGFSWGCLGVTEEYAIEGSFQSGVWNVFFSKSRSMPFKSLYSVVLQGKQLRLEPRGKRPTVLPMIAKSR